MSNKVKRIQQYILKGGAGRVKRRDGLGKREEGRGARQGEEGY